MAKRSSRLTSWPELQAATTAECIRRVEQWAGEGFWTPSQAAYLRASIAPPEVAARRAERNEARALHRELQDSLRRLDDFLARPDNRDPLITYLRQFALDVAAPRTRLWFVFDEQAPRTILVATFDKCDQWWWSDRLPNRTELAVLSILAGNWPERAQAKVKEGLTAADVIGMEAKVIDDVRRRLTNT